MDIINTTNDEDSQSALLFQLPNEMLLNILLQLDVKSILQL